MAARHTAASTPHFCAAAAQRLPSVRDTGAAAGRLLAEERRIAIGLVGRRLFDAHLVKLDLELLGDEHGAANMHFSIEI